METLSFKNKTNSTYTIIIEPIGESQELLPNEKIEFSNDLYLDSRNIIEIEIVDGCIVLFVPEEVEIKRYQN